MYPWGKGSLADRQEDILDALRENTFLDVKEEILPSQLANGTMYLRNLEGQTHEIKTQDYNHQQGKRIEIPVITDANAVSKALEGVCAVLPIQYWNYEWCHRKEIRQVHIEVQNGKITRSPDWSLGSYERSIVVRERGDSTNTSAAIVKVIFSLSLYTLYISDETESPPALP